MAYTFPAMVAWDPNAKTGVLNTVWQVFATTDTSFTTPLSILDPFGNPITGNTLNSGAQGILPQFQQAANATVVVRDLAGHYAWTIIAIQPPTQDSNVATFINTATSSTAAAIRNQTAALWQAGTAYTLGQPVVSPSGDVVTAKTAHTSGGSYTSANWNLSSSFAGAQDGMLLTRLERKGIQANERLGGKAVVAYSDATEIDEPWANLTASDAYTGVTVSGSKLYGSSASSLALRWFPVAVGATARATGAFMYVSGAAGTNAFYAGYEMLAQGAAPVAGTPTGIGIGHQNGVAKGFAGSSIPGTVGTAAPAGFTLTSGKVYEWSIVVDETNVTMSLREQGSAVNFSYWKANRAALTTAGFNLNRIFIYVQDARGSAGASYAFPYAATLSNQPPRTKVLTYGIMGSNHKDVLTASASADNWHIQLPVSYDPRAPAPLCLYLHQAQSGNAEHPFTDYRETPVIKALGDAGFIFASADDGGDRWGSQTSLDAYLSLYQYVQSHYAIGPVVLLGVSMGGMPMLNLVQQRKLPNIAAVAGISPVCDLDTLYSNATYTSTILTAYGAAPDGSDYAAKTAGFNPMKTSGQAFRGVPMRFYTGTADLTVPASTNAVPFMAKIAPFASEATNTVTAGGHIDPSQYQPADLVAFYQNYV